MIFFSNFFLTFEDVSDSKDKGWVGPDDSYKYVKNHFESFLCLLDKGRGQMGYVSD